MSKPTKGEIRKLCNRLEVEPRFFVACLEESIIEIAEIDGQLDLQNGTVLRLRRLQRICGCFDVDIHTALLLADFGRRADRREV